MKTAKKLLRKAKADGRDPFLALLCYRNTPSESMGTSPAQRFLGRRTKTLLPTTSELLKPYGIPIENTKERRKIAQANQAHYYNQHAKDLQTLEEGDVVRMRPFQLGKETWDRAVVRKSLDERAYEIEANDHTYRRNRVDLKKTAESVSPHDYESVPTTPDKPPMESSTANLPKEDIPLSAGTTASSPGTLQSGPVPGPAERPKRTLREPTRFKDFIKY